MKIEIIENDFELTAETALLVPEISIRNERNDLYRKINHSSHFALVALVNQQPAGFKVGYKQTIKTFYSWLGGVLPAFRQMGVGQRLLDCQETWAWNNGCDRIEVKSMNKFPSMLHFLIKNNYQIYAIEPGENFEDSKIRFCKTLGRVPICGDAVG